MLHKTLLPTILLLTLTAIACGNNITEEDTSTINYQPAPATTPTTDSTPTTLLPVYHRRAGEPIDFRGVESQRPELDHLHYNNLYLADIRDLLAEIRTLLADIRLWQQCAHPNGGPCPITEPIKQQT